MQAAADAFDGWRDATPSERSLALFRIADAVEARGEELIALEVENTGKPIALTRSEEIPPTVDQIRFFATAARHLEGKSAGEYMAGHTSFIRREPVGVVRPGRAVELPADDGGVEVRPGDRRRQHGRAQAERHDAGDARRCSPRSPPSSCRPGVFNVICGDRDTGRAMVDHPTPAMVSITGSVRAGMEVAGAAAADLKRVHLELGGKAPVVVFDDADIEAAVEGISIAGYFNAGQDCTAATRVLAGPGVYGDFAAALAEAAKARQDRPARRRGRAVRAGQQRRASSSGSPGSSTGRPTTPGSSPAAPARARPATSTSRPSSPTCCRTTR